MQNTPQISVIVPVYKVEEYLPTCVDSILSQTFTDFELILIDDGGPDGSGARCDAYAAKDSRVRVIHKKNGGPSDARNAALDLAAGQYVTCIDSDDTVHPAYMSRLYEAARQYDADLVQVNLTTRMEELGTEGTDRLYQPYDVKVLSGRESICDYLLYRTHFSNVWGKLIRRELFDGVRFPTGRYSEDEYTTYKLVLKSRRDVCLPTYLYFYRVREGSIVRSFSDERFTVCQELPALMEKDIAAAGYDCRAELDYKNARLQLKIYHDFARGGQYAAFRKQMDGLRKRLGAIPVDYAVWDRRTILSRFAIRYCPGLYRRLVFRRQYGR